MLYLRPVQDILEFSKRSPREKELLWDKRSYLGAIPGALPKVLPSFYS